MNIEKQKKININVELLSKINNVDLADLCNITEEAIKAGGGFGWIKTPPRDVLQKYWKGIILIQNKKLIVGRLDNVIAGTLQITFQPPNNEAQSNIVNITSHFVAPWARGYGLAKAMIDRAEDVGIENGSNYFQLDVRETQDEAIQLYKSKGYRYWGTNPNYAQVGQKIIKGLYFSKKIK
tara:strand:+ start:105 stop:644 length:540 start_codon:yes stop_codon:yes gene_type:complete